MKVKIGVLCFAVFMVSAVCHAEKPPPNTAEETDPAAIINKVTAKYDAMETYMTEGTVLSEVDIGGKTIKMEKTFSITMRKPNLYLISWDQKNGKSLNNGPGAIWNEGAQPYLYLRSEKAYAKISNDKEALDHATGLSGGVPFSILSFFLSPFQTSERFLGTAALKLGRSEKIGGEACYVLIGNPIASMEETFWISKKTYLVKKYSRSIELPERVKTTPPMSDQQLITATKANGQEVTEERKEPLRKVIQKEETLKNASRKRKAKMTEVYIKSGLPKAAQETFAFTLPAGAVLKESLFKRVSNNK